MSSKSLDFSPPKLSPIVIPDNLQKIPGTSGQELLDIERKKATFDVEKMIDVIYTKDERTEHDLWLNLLKDDPIFNKKNIEYMGRTEKFEWAMQKDKALVRLLKNQGIPLEKITSADAFLNFYGPYGIHRAMFMYTLEHMTTPEQYDAFYKPALAHQIAGCYAQTELGHGSNISGLETTAIYNPKTATFDLHSNYLTGCKWWIGNLGRTADHAVVMAQLLTPDEKGKLIPRGPHIFFVNIRDVKTREPLPGCTIFDNGPKIGFPTVDNGSILFNHVQVPHFNMLAKYFKVDKETGRYSTQGDPKLSYGTMTFIRQGIVSSARIPCMRAATIANRYLTVRRQFAAKDAPVDSRGLPIETQTIDYPLVQMRTFPPVASAFAFNFAQRDMVKLFNRNNEAVARGDTSLMQHTHALSSALKSYMTLYNVKMLESLRASLGGHGFSAASGLSSFLLDYLPNVTWEGDSYMLTQQVASYILGTSKKLAKAAQAGPVNADPNSVNVAELYLIPYRNGDLKLPAVHSPDDFTLDFYHKAFALRAAILSGKIEKLVSSGQTLSNISRECFEASCAFSEFAIINSFYKSIKTDPSITNDTAIGQVIMDVFNLFASNRMVDASTDFIVAGVIPPEKYELLEDCFRTALKRIRPNIIPLTDSFNISDFELGSELGRYDGDVYRGLVNYALHEPLNSLRYNPDINSDRNIVGPETASKAKL